MKRTIAVRLEGGIGDHILGMRILYFIRQRFPLHKIIAYSDGGGNQAQVEIAKLSAFISRVICAHQKKTFPKISTWGSLSNIQKKYRDRMNYAELFFDAWGDTFFIEQSRILDVPFYKILGHRPELIIPETFKIEAANILKRFRGSIFVGLNISKYGLSFLRNNKKIVLKFVQELLKNPRVVILNFYTSNYKFPHWPKALRIDRERIAKEDLGMGRLWNISKQVVPLVDFPISIVAAFLQKCSYFIGVDNGLKHLAWALGVPHTFFIDAFPNKGFILRWVPDVNRALLFNCSKEDLTKHLLAAKKAIVSPVVV